MSEEPAAAEPVRAGDVVRGTARGRVPPHNLEAEESLLGAMLLSRDAIYSAIDAQVDAADFYKPAHSMIFDTVTDLYAAGEPVDLVTVGNVLRRRPAEHGDQNTLDAMGGRQALLRLQTGTPASANAGHYAGIVHGLALLRRLIGVAGDVAELGYEGQDDPAEALDQAEALVFAIAEKHEAGRSVGISDALQEELDRLETATPGLLGVPSGFHDLDGLLLGFQASQLIVLAGRPGTGKSSLALGAACSVAIDTQRPVHYFSLEMGRRELAQRAIASEGRVSLRKLRTYSEVRPTLSEADWGRINHAVGRLGGAPLEVDDSGRCTLLDIRAKCRRTRSRYGDLGLVVVDYLQLMTPLRAGNRTSENRQVEVAEISRGLKVLSRELEVPVLALAQLNRQVEHRADKRPILADLRESGALENDADVVAFIFRDELYNPNSEDRGTAEVIVAKHRNGPTGTARLAFLEDQTRFANMHTDRPDPYTQPALGAATF